LGLDDPDVVAVDLADLLRLVLLEIVLPVAGFDVLLEADEDALALVARGCGCGDPTQADEQGARKGQNNQALHSSSSFVRRHPIPAVSRTLLAASFLRASSFT
jgi:hypothetical protein